MRSELVFAAGKRVENRFLLSSTVMRVVKRFHVDATRTEDTINKVFTDMAANPKFVGILPAYVPPPSTIDVLLIEPAA